MGRFLSSARWLFAHSSLSPHPQLQLCDFGLISLFLSSTYYSLFVQCSADRLLLPAPWIYHSSWLISLLSFLIYFPGNLSWSLLICQSFLSPLQTLIQFGQVHMTVCVYMCVCACACVCVLIRHMWCAGSPFVLTANRPNLFWNKSHYFGVCISFSLWRWCENHLNPSTSSRDAKGLFYNSLQAPMSWPWKINWEAEKKKQNQNLAKHVNAYQTVVILHLHSHLKWIYSIFYLMLHILLHDISLWTCTRVV